MTGHYPALDRWFTQRFGEPSEIQRRAWPLIGAGHHTLILAPTGSGKTLAGFLAILSRLATEAAAGELRNEVRAIYVSPIKALASDISRNLEAPLSAVNETLPADERIRMEIRTGDTELAERARMQRRRPHLLLTTPESLTSLLSQSGWRNALRCEAVLVDEIHAFAENKRGTLLALALERLEERGGRTLQRIGMSATAWPVSAVATLLCGQRPCEIASVETRKAHRLEIACPEDGVLIPAAGFGPNRIAPLAAELARERSCTLAFTSTRSAAERLGLALKFLLPEWEERIAVHHGSIDKASRLDIERKLAGGGIKLVVCSTSLELGVDFGAVDQVLLIGTPRGVSTALQRLGRAGHRVDGVAFGLLLPLSLPDLLEATALRAAARAGRLDELRVPSAPLDVLAQTVLGMSVEREWGLDEAFDLIRQAGPYRSLARADFDAVIEYLAGGGAVLGPYGSYGKIVVEQGVFRVASRKVARDFYGNIGAISDEFQVRVVGANRRHLGAVEEGFLASLLPGEAFVMGGKPVRVKSVLQNIAVVEPAAGERVVTPRWMGGRMNLSARLAEEEIRLRRSLRMAWQAGGRPAVEEAMEQEWSVSRPIARRVAGYVQRQVQATPVPVDDPVQLERIRRGGRTLILLFHSVAGRAVNRSLAWVVGHRFAISQERPPSVVANFDDHGFVLSVDARHEPSLPQLREWFNPRGWAADLATVLKSTDTLGRKFRNVAEIGQLLPKRTVQGAVSPKSSAWSGSLLYATLMRHEPEHPLLREAVREVMEDQLDVERAGRQAANIHTREWEVFDLPRPSPFSLPLFAFFHREVLLAKDPDRALEDAVDSMYNEWAEQDTEV